MFMNDEFQPNTHVLIRIAEAFYENNFMKKTHIHFASRVSWISFDKYLEWLKNKNYLECKTQGKHEEYQPTSTGYEMFKIILQFKEHIKSS